MNQIEKTEIIINLVAIVKSKLMAEIFSEKKKDNPDSSLIMSETQKVNELEVLLRSFYEKFEISDQEYDNILKKVKEYE